MTPNALERLPNPNESQVLSSETGDLEIRDFQIILEERHPQLISDPTTFIQDLKQKAEGGIHPAIQEIMNKGWYPDETKNLENAAVFEHLQGIVKDIKDMLPIDDSRVVCPELIEMFEITKESLEKVVGVYPEDRISMLFDSIEKRSERYKAYSELSKLGRSRVIKILESLEIPWRSYGELQKIYPELLEDPETWTLGRMSKPKGQYKCRGEDSGLIKNPELVKNLSELELFSLIYVLDVSVGYMNVGNALGEMAGIVKIFEDVRWLKVDRARNFLMHEVKKRLDESSNPLGIRFWGEVFVPWFCFYEKFFSWRLYKDDCKKGLKNALEVGLLMRAARDGHEEDIKGFLPNKEDWREYELEEGNLERIRL